MTPIQKAKEIFLAAWEYWRISAVESPSLTFDNWTKTDEGKQLLSGEDWKEDEKVVKSFLVEWLETDGKVKTRRTTFGFNALELLGLMEEVQFDIHAQLRGQSDLPVMEKKRIVPEPPKP